MNEFEPNTYDMMHLNVQKSLYESNDVYPI